MKTTFNLIKVASSAGILILFLLSLYLFISNTSLNNSEKKEKIKSEKLLSEKLKLDETILQLKKEFTQLELQNKEMKNYVAENRLILKQKEDEIQGLIKQKKSFDEIKKKYAELDVLYDKMKKEIAQYKEANELLKQENTELMQQITEKQKENESLYSDNMILKAISANNYRVEALRGKQDKLTLNAKRVHKLMVSFDLPVEQEIDIHFNLIIPEGSEYSSKNNKSAQIHISEISEPLLAYASTGSISNTHLKRIELVYKPQTKLTKGIYRFNIYNGENIIGSTQLRLK